MRRVCNLQISFNYARSISICAKTHQFLTCWINESIILAATKEISIDSHMFETINRMRHSSRYFVVAHCVWHWFSHNMQSTTTISIARILFRSSSIVSTTDDVRAYCRQRFLLTNADTFPTHLHAKLFVHYNNCSLSFTSIGGKWIELCIIHSLASLSNTRCELITNLLNSWFYYLNSHFLCSINSFNDCIIWEFNYL